MRPHRSIILSDLHLGPVGPATIFRDGHALRNFLDRLAAEDGRFELILAGDTFDFLACPGYAGFDRGQAQSRLQLILQNNPEVVEAIRRVAARHKVTILSGNHDPEVLLPEVRKDLAAALGVSNDADEVLVPGPGERPPVYGRSLADGRVFVVHGDRWDPQNAIDRQSLLSHGTIELPAGSHLVYEVLAQLQPIHRWICELKPEVPTVVPLLLYLDRPRTMSILEQYSELTVQLLGGALAAQLRSGELFGEPAEMHAPPDLLFTLATLLAGQLREEPEGEQEILRVALLDYLRYGQPASGTLAAHDGVGRFLLRTWLRGVRIAGRFDSFAKPDSIATSAEPYLPPEVRYLVAGHTHSTRFLPALDGNRGYCNTGTWVPVGRLPSGEMRQVLDHLESGGPWPAEVPRTFAVVDEEPLDVWLGRCDEDGTPRKVAP